MIATPTVMPTFGFQDRLRSQLVSSSVRQDGAHVQLQSNQRRHDGFELLSSRPSRQIDSGDRLERLEQVVESIALQLRLLVDDDEANIFEQDNQHTADVRQNPRIIVFRMTMSRKSRIHGRNAKLLPLIKMSMRKTLYLPVNSGKLTKIITESLLIVTLFSDLLRRTLKDGMYRMWYQIIH